MSSLRTGPWGWITERSSWLAIFQPPNAGVLRHNTRKFSAARFFFKWEDVLKPILQTKSFVTWKCFCLVKVSIVFFCEKGSFEVRRVPICVCVWMGVCVWGGVWPQQMGVGEEGGGLPAPAPGAPRAVPGPGRRRGLHPAVRPPPRPPPRALGAGHRSTYTSECGAMPRMNGTMRGVGAIPATPR